MLARSRYKQGDESFSALSVDRRGGVRSMAIYKRCAHRGRDRDRCPHPWYGSYKLPGEARARVSLTKWNGEDGRTEGHAQAALDHLKAAIRDGTFNTHRRSAAIRRRAMPFPQPVDRY